MRRDPHARYRKAVAHTFGWRVDIRLRAGKIVRKKAAAAAVPALDAIGDVHRAVRRTQRADFFQKRLAGHMDTAHALNAFHNYRRNIFALLPESGFQRLDVVVRQKNDAVGLVDRRYDFRIVGSGHGQGGASVKSLFKSYYFFSAGVKRRQFERILVGFGARIAEKKVVVVFAGESAQRIGEFLLDGKVYLIGYTKECF